MTPSSDSTSGVVVKTKRRACAIVSPNLRSLKLEVEEQRGASTLAETRHVRVIVVERAPALFLLPCGDRDCRDGGHDVTDAVLRNLLSGAERFEIEDTCIGNIRSAECGRMVRIVAKATYGA